MWEVRSKKKNEITINKTKDIYLPYERSYNIINRR
jgi:hypothetical protein